MSLQSAPASPNGATPLLSATALEGQRGERVLFRGLHLALLPGEVVWLRGRNGRGKTSLLRLLAGLATPAAGAIVFNGTPLARSAAWRSELVYIAHANALKDDLSAAESLAFVAGLGGRVPDGAALLHAMQRLGVADCARRPVRTLSQGQRRRVALARLALPQAPRLWLLDEPFDALDDKGIVALNTLLSEHSARGGAALLTSHQALTLREPVPRELSLDGALTGAISTAISVAIPVAIPAAIPAAILATVHTATPTDAPAP